MLFVGSNPTPSTTNEKRFAEALAPGRPTPTLSDMSLRRYRVLAADGSEAEILEVEHVAGAEDITLHPIDGRRLVRLLEMPTLGSKWTDRAMAKAAVDSKILKAGGFRRLESDGKTWHDIT